ncbi:MAG TPA: DUF202 domain-containing protein [Streptosporangiaceae bacterium]|nr:DUF202 domain-containing protein [Streptosporangiaceae bacterium]
MSDPPDDPDLDPGLAGERTRMAWVRTAIAFAAVGAVIARKELVPGALVVATSPLVGALGHYAVRDRQTQARSKLLLLVTLTVLAIATLAVTIALVGASPTSLRDLLPLHG